MSDTRDCHKRQVLLQEPPGVVERAGKQVGIVQAVKLQHRRLHHDDRAVVFYIRRSGIVGLVVVKHPFEVRIPERLDVSPIQDGVVSMPSGQLLRTERQMSAFRLEASRIGAVLVLLVV